MGRVRVPLFVEELTRTVLESGLLQESPEGYRLAGPLRSLAIPSTLQDSLTARLDRLSPTKEVAQVGSVIGREFTRADVTGSQPVAIINESFARKHFPSVDAIGEFRVLRSLYPDHCGV